MNYRLRLLLPIYFCCDPISSLVDNSAEGEVTLRSSGCKITLPPPVEEIQRW